MSKSQGAKLNYIFWLKGLGISLVVFGHFYASAFVLPGFNEAHRVVYLFHMPLFMAISGFLYARSPRTTLGGLVRKKFMRLMIPYVSISVVILAAKLTAGFMHFDLQHPVNSQDWLAFLFYPQRGFACFLWYIYTLFVIFVLMGLMDVVRLPLWGRVVLAVMVRYICLPRYFCLDLVGSNLVYFVFGMLIARLSATSSARDFRISWGLLAGAWALFGGLAWLVLMPGTKFWMMSWIAALAGIAASWLTALRLGQGGRGLLAGLGSAASAIYLLHTLPMGIVRMIWEYGLGVDSGWSHLLFFASSMGLGLAVPVWLQRDVLDRIPMVSRILLGTGPMPLPRASSQISGTGD